MSELSIKREGEPTHGRYVARLAGIDAEAELTFSHLGDRLVSADHTRVPDALRGKGVGQALVEHLVADAKAQGCKIVPRCPFVNAEQKKHREWRDVFQI